MSELWINDSLVNKSLIAILLTIDDYLYIKVDFKKGNDDITLILVLKDCVKYVKLVI